MKEHEDYDLISGDDPNHWNIRIKAGEFAETVFNFGALTVHEKNESISFSLNIVSTPDPDLIVDDIDFQLYCGKILHDVIDGARDRAGDTTTEIYDETDTY